MPFMTVGKFSSWKIYYAGLHGREDVGRDNRNSVSFRLIGRVRARWCIACWRPHASNN